MAKKSSSFQRQNRKIMPGFPWEGKFQTREEIDDYFSGDQIQCLLCGKWYKEINYAHLSRIHDTTVDEYKERYGLPWSRGLTGESAHENYVRIGKECLVDGKIPWVDYRALRKTKRGRRRSVQPFVITNQRLTIEEMRQIARERGGKCLSSKYDGAFTKLLWQCSEGHQWRTTPSCIKSGTWCPSCAGVQKGTLKEMQKIAGKREGKCLSLKYVNIFTKLLWECSKGHQWEATPNSVKGGTWCPSCAGKLKKGTIEEMREIARKRGGECLSTTYINSQTKLSWQCSKGHQWEAMPANVKSGQWCPSCAGVQKGTIKEMRKIARKRGGKCLSAIYINSNTKLLWQCAEGHKWKARPAGVKSGKWCPFCAGVKKGTIEEMREIAQDRGGKCLSSTYINNATKLLWGCRKGHRWKATPRSVKIGTWCPSCAGVQKGTIKEMRKIARERGGKCLSSTYTNNRTKLLWQCSKGHQWEAKPANVKFGQWCPICANTRRSQKLKSSK